jgi:hypothetical protein
MKALFEKVFVLSFILLTTGSCKKKESDFSVDSLVYVKNGLNKSVTGFVIANEGNKYYVLVPKHIMSNSQTVLLFPHLNRKIKNVNNLEEFGSSSVFTSEKYLLPASKVDLEEIDVSIITINTDDKLNIANLEINPDSGKTLEMHGFTRCSASSEVNSDGKDSENKDYFYHKTSGEFFRKEDIQKLPEINRGDNQKFTAELQASEEENKMMARHDMRYRLPTTVGMSGSPVLNSNRRVTGMQIAMYEPQVDAAKALSNCTIQPALRVGYGVSMQRIFASRNFPENLKKLVQKVN